MATLPYSPPNVNVTEEIDPSISPFLALPALTALVGLTQGGVTRSDTITLLGTADGGDAGSDPDQIAVPLPNVPVGAKVTQIIEVTDVGHTRSTPYVEDDDYDVTISANPQSSTNNSATITRVVDGDIPAGVSPNYEASVVVTYKYIPEGYFSPIILDNLPDIEDRFGSAWTSDGLQVNTPLSYAAHLLFENGASQVVCQPLFKVSSGDRVQPNVNANPSEATLAGTWDSSFSALHEIDDVNIIVPVIGQSDEDMSDAALLAVAQELQDHIYDRRADNQEYAIGIFGEDGSVSPVTRATLLAHAATLTARRGGVVAEQMVMVTPTRFIRSTPVSSSGLVVGGQYMAAAIAGMLASRPVSSPLTRKAVSGFLEIAEARTKAQKNEEAGKGMLVIDRNKDGLIQVRHGITLDTTSTPKRELSVVRAKHRVIESVKDTIDDQIIGQVIADGQAALVIRAAVAGVLDQLRGDNDIVSYSDIQSRVTSLDPTTVEVRFSYAPAFPVNYVNIFFSLDLTNNTIEVSESTE